METMLSQGSMPFNQEIYVKFVLANNQMINIHPNDLNDFYINPRQSTSHSTTSSFSSVPVPFQPQPPVTVYNAQTTYFGPVDNGLPSGHEPSPDGSLYNNVQDNSLVTAMNQIDLSQNSSPPTAEGTPNTVPVYSSPSPAYYEDSSPAITTTTSTTSTASNSATSSPTLPATKSKKGSLRSTKSETKVAKVTKVKGARKSKKEATSKVKDALAESFTTRQKKKMPHPETVVPLVYEDHPDEILRLRGVEYPAVIVQGNSRPIEFYFSGRGDIKRLGVITNVQEFNEFKITGNIASIETNGDCLMEPNITRRKGFKDVKTLTLLSWVVDMPTLEKKYFIGERKINFLLNTDDFPRPLIRGINIVSWEGELPLVYFSVDRLKKGPIKKLTLFGLRRGELIDPNNNNNTGDSSYHWSIAFVIPQLMITQDTSLKETAVFPLASEWINRGYKLAAHYTHLPTSPTDKVRKNCIRLCQVQGLGNLINAPWTYGTDGLQSLSC
ncbi:hypothetical protein SAMD00019534_013320 [Acytostelium subglobosum LB1]|uniref:hypothetical protein n=1 Tax=Acytostelium subglobosum LB1 TaxID=1410327 RepID=UPI0006448D60|nr:hypothetical protein SAMD00019534_013320 [Acytostelium subglobosum LB1]GAM18157.1 hypothetical protein SAMD00019534_013320 [Acytostelium subglobosum LB1]|eukprot:XP_012758753.1 hypothetical protein SAMD00019534_013320 [Acytostelium subglobosum LB1]